MTLPLAPGRHLWLQTVAGRLRVDGTDLLPGDGLAASNETELRLTAGDQGAELLAFDLA